VVSQWIDFASVTVMQPKMVTEARSAKDCQIYKQAIAWEIYQDQGNRWYVSRIKSCMLKKLHVIS
jgi:hypothetical protein